MRLFNRKVPLEFFLIAAVTCMFGSATSSIIAWADGKEILGICTGLAAIIWGALSIWWYRMAE